MRDVTDNTMLPHEYMAEMLPDYAVGALPEDEFRLVEDHLAGCDRCQRELDTLLQVLSQVVDTGQPSADARRRFLARLAPVRTWPSVTTTPPAPIAFPSPSPRVRSGRRHRQLESIGWAVAAIFLVATLALGGWNLLLRQELSDESRIAGLIAGPDTAHVLSDTDLSTGATGVMYVDPGSDQALLVASGLPRLPPDRGYQIWLFTESGQQVNAGFFPVEESGLGQALIRAPAPMGEYVAVALSAEPLDGSEVPTAPLSLGGWIQ